LKSDYRNVLSMAHGAQDLTGWEGEVESARARGMGYKPRGKQPREVRDPPQSPAGGGGIGGAGPASG
jgi:hypothetical protein